MFVTITLIDTENQILQGAAIPEIFVSKRSPEILQGYHRGEAMCSTSKGGVFYRSMGLGHRPEPTPKSSGGRAAAISGAGRNLSLKNKKVGTKKRPKEQWILIQFFAGAFRS